VVLDRLETEGLLDNTLILFFGDHGRPHVRGKRWLYDGGVHTPLIVAWPGRVPAAHRDDRLVSLLDLVPTSLVAAGLTDQVQALPGRNLFARDWPGREYVFTARDRCGDAPDRIRSVRSRDFKYIRNFYLQRPYQQLSSYKKLMYPTHTVMHALKEQGAWDSPFMAETRPQEEFYDLKKSRMK